MYQVCRTCVGKRGAIRFCFLQQSYRMSFCKSLNLEYYVYRVEETVTWMDCVNDCLKEVNKETSCADEYEKNKEKFVVRIYNSVIDARLSDEAVVSMMRFELLIFQFSYLGVMILFS